MDSKPRGDPLGTRSVETERRPYGDAQLTGPDTTSVLVRRISQLLAQLDHPPSQDPIEIRAEVKRLVAVLRGVRRLGPARLGGITGAKAARERILTYLKLFVGEAIDGEELQVVSGIQEFARRVRELRVQYGYNISTGVSSERLKPNQYVLESATPDGQAAEKWQTANSVRRGHGGAKDRILAFLKENVGRPVTGEQLAYVAKTRETGRRIRELRTELGYRVVTRFTGRPDLPGGVYVLESLDQLPVHDRRIPPDVYDGVLRRDNNRCRKCAWSVEQRRPGERRQFLEVHHIEHHGQGGANNEDNLITLCNVDHDDVHRRGLIGDDFFGWLNAVR